MCERNHNLCVSATLFWRALRRVCVHFNRSWSVLVSGPAVLPFHCRHEWGRRRGEGEWKWGRGAINMETRLSCWKRTGSTIGAFPLSKARISPCLCPHECAHLWMKSRPPPSSAPANQGSRAREPSNSGRGVGREQPIASRGFLIWIFQLFFIHKKRERRKVRDGEREGEKNSIHKKPALARRVLTCFLFFFFCFFSSDELWELDFVYLKHTTRLTEKLIKHKWEGNSGTNHCSDSWH